MPAFLLAFLAPALYFWLARRVANYARAFVTRRGHSPNATTVTPLIARWRATTIATHKE